MKIHVVPKDEMAIVGMSIIEKYIVEEKIFLLITIIVLEQINEKNTSENPIGGMGKNAAIKIKKGRSTALFNLQ